MRVVVVEEIGQTARLGSIGHNGWSGAAGSWYRVDPRERLVGIVMIQARRDPIGSEMAADFETLAYQALK